MRVWVHRLYDERSFCFAEDGMKFLRRLLFVISLIIAALCIVVLLNFTATNPTGRRYSSASPVMTGDAQAIGLSGEEILARDLRLPRNDAPDQRQCICNNPNVSTGANDCRVCITSDASISTYRRPDFISDRFIAESKNRQNLLYTHTDQIDQITDYVTAAQLLKRPLWLYTRVDTRLDAEFYRLVEATGGGIVPYFTTAGYVDPVDQAARSGLIVSLVLLALTGIWEIGARQVRTGSAPKAPQDASARSQAKTDAAGDFVKSAKERAQRKIDTEDARGNDQK
jgi:hypothetical protein